MRLSTIALLCLLASFALASADEFLDLDFEIGTPGAGPRHWYHGGEGYSITLSEDRPKSGGMCLFMEKTDPASDGFGVATGKLPLDLVKGRTVRFSGWIRTEGVTDEWAGLWFRVDGPDGHIGFDNMQDRGVKGDTDWARYSIELPVGEEAINVVFGCLHTGSGKAWFDAFTITIDGEPYEPEAPRVFVPTEEQIAWISDNAHVFATDDPAGGDEDLGFLSDMVGDARIVALGEATHGTAEFFNMKHRITRYLVEHHGFTVFGIEAAMAEAERLNDYVRGGEGDAAELITGMYFWTWRTEEVLAMVEWMRAHNAAGGHIEFRGFDVQHPGLPMKNALDFIGEHAPDLAMRAAVAYAEMRGIAKSNPYGPKARDAVSDRLQGEIDAVYETWKSRRDDLVGDLPAAEVDWAIQNARLVAQYGAMLRGGSGGRDLAMADNADWLLEQAGPEGRVVLWAHNGHVSRAGWSGVRSQGHHLAARHGDDLVVFGFTFDEGEYTAMKKGEGLGTWGTGPTTEGSVEWAFRKTGLPRLMLDLRVAQPGSPDSGWVFEDVDYRSIGAAAKDDGFTNGVLAEHFDVVIHFAQTRPSVLLDAESPSPWAMWDD